MTAAVRLSSWHDGPTRQAILDFVDASQALPVEDRVALFDHDGTLWCEKPVYAQLQFMIAQLHEAVAKDPSLGQRPEYKALLDHDEAAQADLGLPAIAMALVELCAGIPPQAFEDLVTGFMETARHADRDVPIRQMRYVPMLELMAELRAHDFTVFIVTGGGTEFVRAISNDFYGVERERVVGSQVGYEFVRGGDGTPRLQRTREVFGKVDEGEAKVVNLQNGIGRRPVFAAGNSPGDTEMLQYVQAHDGPSLALLVNHDDTDREYAYVGRAETFTTTGSLVDEGRAQGWTIVSMKNDWRTVFDPVG